MSKGLGLLMGLAVAVLSDPAFNTPKYKIRDFKVKGGLPKEKISKRSARRKRGKNK